MRVWDPFREVDEMIHDLQPVLTSILLSPQAGRQTGWFLPGTFARAYPRTNVSEDQDNVYVEALAPGIDTGTLDVKVQRNVLTIAGAKPGPTGVPAEAFYVNERGAGKFVRSVELPVEVDGDRVSARYANGILTVTLPKHEHAKPKQIQVAVS